MELVSKLRRLTGEEMASLVKFALDLPGTVSDVAEDGTVKIHFDKFDGATWQQVMEFVDSLTKVETDTQPHKTEGVAFPPHMVMNACE